MPSLLDVISPNSGLLGEDILQTGLTDEQKDLLRRRAYWQSGMATLGNVVDRLASPMRPPPMLDPAVSSGPARYQQMLMAAAEQQQAAQKLAAQRQAQTALQEIMATPETDRVGKLNALIPSLILGGYSSAIEPLMNLAAFQQDQAVIQALQGAPSATPAGAPAGAPTAAMPAGAPTAAMPAGASAGAPDLVAEYSQLSKEIETLSRFPGELAQKELKWRRERRQEIADALQEKQLTPFQQRSLEIQAGQLAIAQANAARQALESSPEHQAMTETAKQEAKAKTEARAAADAKKRIALAGLTNAGINLETGEDPVANLINASTSGGKEALAASATGFVTGKATPGMEAIGELRTVASKLTLDLVEGRLGAGLSNEDRKMIERQLGEIGDPMIPANQRLAGWNKIKSILAANAGVTLPEFSSGAPAASARSRADAILQGVR